MEKVEYVEPPPTYKIDEFTIGIDFGEIKDSTAVVLMCSINDFEQVRILEEFEYKPNKDYFLERDEIAEMVNEKILD